MKPKKAKNIRFRAGGWRVIVCVAALVLAILFGLWSEMLPTTLKRIDITPQQMYTLSDTTKELLNGLQSDVKILYLAESGAEDAQLRELIARYEAACERVRFSYIDATDAAYYTADTLTENSVIVTNGEYDAICDYSTLYSLIYDSESAYRTPTDYLFSAENTLNKAIASVTSELPIAYLIGGHSETVPGSDFSGLLADAGMHEKTLYLAEVSAIPEDAALIVINAPQTDITGKEAELLKDYLLSGGSVLLATDAKAGELTNLRSVCENLGLLWTPGVVMDAEAEYLYNPEYAYYLLPEASEDALTAALSESGERALLSQAHAIQIAESENGSKPRALLLTSPSSFLKPNAYVDGVLTYAQGDPVGPHALAAVSETETGGKLFWVSSSQCLTDEINEMSYGANYLLAGSVLTWMHGDAEPLVDEVPSVSLMVDAPVYSQARYTTVLAILIALPAALLLVGIIVRYRPRGKKL